MASIALMDFIRRAKKCHNEVYVSHLYNDNTSTFLIGNAIKVKCLNIFFGQNFLRIWYVHHFHYILVQHSVLYCNYVISEDDSCSPNSHQQHFIQTKPYNPPFLIKLTFSFSLISSNSAAILLILKCKAE